MLDWHSCQICYPLEIKILLLLLLLYNSLPTYTTILKVFSHKQTSTMQNIFSNLLCCVFFSSPEGNIEQI